MPHLCEVLSILATISAGGGAGLESRCVESIAACNERWKAETTRQGAGSVLGQCIVITDLIEQRDVARKHAKDGRR